MTLWLAAIARLFFLCCPAAIRRFVVAVIVDPIDRVLWRRSAPHIGEEITEGVAPSIAYANASSTVILETAALGSFASIDHVPPCAEFRRRSMCPEWARGLAVNGPTLARTIILEASTRLSRASHQARGASNRLLRTITSADKTPVATSAARGLGQDNEPCKSLSYLNQQWAHDACNYIAWSTA